MHLQINAQVAELVDALDSKSSGPQGRVGSSPTLGTKQRRLWRRCFLCYLFTLNLLQDFLIIVQHGNTGGKYSSKININPGGMNQKIE